MVRGRKERGNAEEVTRSGREEEEDLVGEEGDGRKTLTSLFHGGKGTLYAVYELPPSVYELPPSVYELPPSVYELPPSVYELPPSVYELPPPVYELPPSAYVLPPPRKDAVWTAVKLRS